MLNRLIDNLTRDQDKASFDDWDRPRCENGVGASVASMQTNGVQRDNLI